MNHGFPKLGITKVAVQQRIVSDLRYLAKQAGSSNKPYVKANNAKVEKNSKQSSDDDEASKASGGSSKKNSKTIADMDEDYAQTGDSEDSGGRG